VLFGFLNLTSHSTWWSPVLSIFLKMT
jgi:hypothetical protein